MHIASLVPSRLPSAPAHCHCSAVVLTGTRRHHTVDGPYECVMSAAAASAAELSASLAKFIGLDTLGRGGLLLAADARV